MTHHSSAAQGVLVFLGWGIGSSQSDTGQHMYRKDTYILLSSGVRIQDPNIWYREDNTRLTSRSHCDRPHIIKSIIHINTFLSSHLRSSK
jgi:hypothetical protein